jgi:alanyl-tRNA synthetase
MVDEQTAESVTSDVPVSVTPEQLNQPVRPSEPQAGGAGDEVLKHKLALANTHAKRAEKDADEARKQMQQLKDELEQLKQVQQAAVQKNLEDQGAYKQLWEDVKKTVASRDAEILELKAQLESVTQNAQQERLKAAATAQISRANAVNPTQLYQLLAPQLRTDGEGNAVVLNGGVEQPLQDFLANLKQSADWQHHFSSTGAIGMGASAASVAPGMTNPYRTGNLTEALMLEASNPDLAKALKAEAQRG